MVIVRFAASWVVLGLLLSGCGNALHVRPGQPEGPPEALPEERVLSRVFLIGDAGRQSSSRLVMPHVLESMDEKSYTVFLGDNLYEWDDWESVLDVQLAALERGRGALFMAGNHDWDRGYEGLALQAQYVQDRGADFLPEPGCPGPRVHALPGVRILVLDSQWWHVPEEDRPSIDCPHDEVSAIAALAEELARGDGFEIVLAHHPLESFGKHGGHFPWYQHLLPPILGSIYVWVRQSGVANQDLNSTDYRAWAEGMRGALEADPPILYAAGHEHSLQVLAGAELGAEVPDTPPYPEAVSGAGSKKGWVGAGDRTLYSEDSYGYMLMTILDDGRAALEAFRVKDENTVARAWAGWLTGAE